MGWSPRTPTKTGTIDQPKLNRSRVSEAATATRRKEDRYWDRVALAKYVQLQPGMLIVWDRKPYRILEIREKPDDLWPERFEEGFARDVRAWEAAAPERRGERPERATWRYRPVNLVIVPADRPTAKPTHLVGLARQQWDVLPEHYAVCVACGELPPCSHELAEHEIDMAMAKSEDLMQVKPGCCLGCTEPITSRMKAVRFPGPNLWRPDFGNDSAVFHARQECADAVYRYREQWKTKGHEEQQLAFPEEG